jgi:hypothetical protein
MKEGLRVKLPLKNTSELVFFADAGQDGGR